MYAFLSVLQSFIRSKIWRSSFYSVAYEQIMRLPKLKQQTKKKRFVDKLVVRRENLSEFKLRKVSSHNPAMAKSARWIADLAMPYVRCVMLISFKSPAAMIAYLKRQLHRNVRRINKINIKPSVDERPSRIELLPENELKFAFHAQQYSDPESSRNLTKRKRSSTHYDVR